MSARTLVKPGSLSAVETWVAPAGLVAVLTLYASLALATLRVPAFRLYSGGDHSTVLASTDITAKLRR